ncbi:MAG: hypothetical protein HYZ17_16675 [Betaproteobacteria bacterium]|nr:hypothetical protein [Betaproteobacteria bacterium]
MRGLLAGAMLIALAHTLGGCSLMAPSYSPSMENVQKLKSAGDFSASVGKFESAPDKGNANPISLRGSSMSSPYEGSYAAYLAEAIRQELSLAGKLKPGTEIEISGVLQKNDIHAAGIVTASGGVEARFAVKRAGKIVFDKVKFAGGEWESSFVGGIAIPRAQQEYPRLVQRLLAELYSDRDFFAALKTN